MPADARDEFRRYWPVLLAAMIGVSVGVNGLPYYTIGVFIDPLARQFGWSRSAISLWGFFLTGGGALAAPAAGWATDRFGARRVVLVSIPLLAASVAGASLIGARIWMLYTAVGAMAVLGSGASGIPYGKTVNSWFSAGRGLALGIFSAGIGLMSIFGPRLVQAVVDAVSWRAGLVEVGAVALAAWPLMYFLLHERREAPAAAGGGVPAGVACREALRMPVFWYQAMAYGLFSLLVGAVVVLLVPFLTDHGLSRARAAEYAGLLGAGSFLGRIAAGYLFDRLRAPYVCAAVFALGGVAVASLGFFGAAWAPASIAAIGLSLGSEVSALGYITARYFGLRAYGTIFALLAVLNNLGGGLGPFAVSLAREATGGYEAPFLILGALAAVAAVLMALMGRHPFLDEAAAAGGPGPVPEGRDSPPARTHGNSR